MTSSVSSPALMVEADHRSVLRLFRHTARYHLHLDWHTLEQWLSHPALRCRVVRQNGVVQALIGATVQVPPSGSGCPVAWLRLIVPPAMADSTHTLDALWEALCTDLTTMGVHQIAILAIEEWVEAPAERWGFEYVNSVVTLRREQGIVPPEPAAPLSIREVATDADLDAVVRVDTAAFEPIWQYDRSTLLEAWRQAVTFTVLERSSEIIGYQLSTSHLGDGHLARLAVVPEEQGQGLGALLIGGVLRYFQARHVRVITVNTQSDNIRSQRLYTRLGFRLEGRGVPVWMYEL